jgi:hypothetical protein
MVTRGNEIRRSTTTQIKPHAFPHKKDRQLIFTINPLLQLAQLLLDIGLKLIEVQDPLQLTSYHGCGFHDALFGSWGPNFRDFIRISILEKETIETSGNFDGFEKILT